MNLWTFHYLIILGMCNGRFHMWIDNTKTFYSDEGDSSSSSDDEGKDSLCDLEGPCCQALRVPPCSPNLTPEKKSKKKV